MEREHVNTLVYLRKCVRERRGVLTHTRTRGELETVSSRSELKHEILRSSRKREKKKYKSLIKVGQILFFTEKGGREKHMLSLNGS